MAKITSITIGMGRTYRGPIEYESFRIDGAITIELEPGDDPAEVRTKSFPLLREQMRETYREFKPPKPEKKK